MKNIYFQVRKDLAELNKFVDYVVIRNYEFLFDPKEESTPDVDLFVLDLTSSQKKHIEEHGYSLVSDGPYRTVFVKFFLKQKYLFFLDIHKKNITGNAVSYGIEFDILTNKKLKQGIPVAKDEYYLAALLLRGLVSRNFNKYQARLTSLMESSNLVVVTNILSKSLGKKDAKKVISCLERRDFKILNRKRKLIKCKFISRKIKSYIYTLKSLEPKKPRIIAVIGMDGSGKTTVTKECYSILKRSGAKIKMFYFGRGAQNILPVQRPATIVKKRSVDLPKPIKTLIYSSASFVYAFDFLLRYFTFRKRKYTMIMGDRFSSDILLMPNVPKFLRRALHTILPKADLYIYLYNDLTVLRKRSGHDLEDLKRQKEEFKWINYVLKSKKIKNQNLEQTIEESIKLILRIGQPTNSE